MGGSRRGGTSGMRVCLSALVLTAVRRPPGNHYEQEVLKARRKMTTADPGHKWSVSACIEARPGSPRSRADKDATNARSGRI
jgi:hypothetical protein